MMSTISYLVPSYNHSLYLLLLLESIQLDISHLNVAAEVIIIDDGSSDDSPQIIKEWAHANGFQFKVRFLIQSNQGVSTVLNKLVYLSTGEYLRLTASDDIITPGSTQLLYDQFISNPLLKCVVADGSIIDAEGRQIHHSSIKYHKGNIKRLLNRKTLTKELINHWCIAGPSHLIKKQHYQTFQYDEKLTIDDFDLFLSFLDTPESVLFLNTTVCSYRIHTTNTSKTSNKAKRINNIQSFIKTIDRYIDQHEFNSYLRPIKYLSKAKVCFLSEKYVSCLFNLSLSLFFKFIGGFQKCRN